MDSMIEQTIEHDIQLEHGLLHLPVYKKYSTEKFGNWIKRPLQS